MVQLIEQVTHGSSLATAGFGSSNWSPLPKVKAHQTSVAFLGRQRKTGNPPIVRDFDNHPFHTSDEASLSVCRTFWVGLPECAVRIVSR
jgi:hypothetical protein